MKSSAIVEVATLSRTTLVITFPTILFFFSAIICGIISILIFFLNFFGIFLIAINFVLLFVLIIFLFLPFFSYLQLLNHLQQIFRLELFRRR